MPKNKMLIPMGTRSLLFGAHQFIIHPIFVFLSWWKLYGFPNDPRLWVCFVIHDWGYWGKKMMDDADGELHPIFGASIMGRLFGQEWSDLCMYHSRFLAKRDGKPFSRLCVADKLSFVLTPKVLYLTSVKLTGEIKEYMELAKARTEIGEPKYASMNIASDDIERWYYDVREYLERWVDTHKDGREDTWTPKGNILSNDG